MAIELDKTLKGNYTKIAITNHVLNEDVLFLHVASYV